MDKFLIIDSFALIFRAYYAYPDSLTDKSGAPINAAYGFTSLLIDTLLKFDPEYVVAVFDPQSPIIRQSDYVLYKANRKETDKALLDQIPVVREILENFDIPVLSVDGYEADDVIGTLVERFKKDNLDKIVVTGDQDIFQLIDDKTQIYLAGRKFSESKLYDREGVIGKLGITPEQVPHYKGLAGDPSDNIPGVNGIGKKSAEDLLKEFGTVENIYDNLDSVSPRQRTKLSEDYEMAIKSLQLATIMRNVPLGFELESARLKTIKFQKVKAIFEELQFKSLLKKLDSLQDMIGIEDFVGLFDADAEVINDFEQSIDAKEFSDLKLEKESNIFVLCLNTNREILTETNTFAGIYAYDTKDFYYVSENDISDFLNTVKDKEATVVSIDLKTLTRVANNGKHYKFKQFDLGFASRILSEGLAGYDIDGVFDYVQIRKPASLKEIIEKLPEIYTKLKDEFAEKKKLYNVFRMEMEIIPVIIEMERNGIILDQEAVKDFEKQLEKKKLTIQNEIFGLVGHEFNLNSPKQVGQVLFEERDLPGARKTKSGTYSTNESVLAKLKDVDPIVENILSYREIDKILSTYVKALPSYVQDDGRVHSSFDQMGAVSGRFSSKYPNLQNIPTGETAGVVMRDAFISDKDAKFIAFDYSQQELRILAALSKETALIEAFNSNKDIHRVTAAALFEKTEEEVTKNERDFGKTMNFSIVYGISAFGLSERLDIDRKAATDLITRFYEQYPGIQSYYEAQKKSIMMNGYSETVMGRRRSADPLRTANRFAKQAIERELLNFSIQGSAADLMKLAMVSISKSLDKHKAKLLLQIHDEFVFEFYGNDTEQQVFINDIKKDMESVVDIGVGYKVEVKEGNRWGKMNNI